MSCIRGVPHGATFRVGALRRMSDRPALPTSGAVENRRKPSSGAFAACVLGLLLACLATSAEALPANQPAETDSRLAGLRGDNPANTFAFTSPEHSGIPREPAILTNDALDCVESEDVDSFGEEIALLQTFQGVLLLSLSDFSCPTSPRAPHLPILSISGLMSRRF